MEVRTKQGLFFFTFFAVLCIAGCDNLVPKTKAPAAVKPVTAAAVASVGASEAAAAGCGNDR